MTITKEGALASFYTTNKAPIKHLRVYFSSKQTGTGDPSPENVREIEGYNQINVELGSENLTQFSSSTTTWYKPTNFSSNYVTYYGYIDNTLGNTNVKLAARTSSTYYSDAVKPGERGAVYIHIPISNATSAQLKISNASANTVIQQRGLWPYIAENNKTINFDETIYGGYVDLVTGELIEDTIYLNMANYLADKNIEMVNGTLCRIKSSYSVASPNICSHFVEHEIKNWGTMTEITGNTCWWGNGYIGFASSTLGFNTAEQWKNWLIENNVGITAKLNTPITHQLTPTQLQTLIGRNNIWSNADRVEVEYDLAESNDELYRRRNIILRSAPHIETASGNIATFNTDMVVPIKSAKMYFNPVQEGTGDPSLENVRNISGWTGLNLQSTNINIWDEQTEPGSISISTGENSNTGVGSQIRTKNYIPVIENTEYVVITGNSGSSYGIWMLFYDKNKNLITTGLPNGSSYAAKNARCFYKNAKVLMPNNCAYIRWYFQVHYGFTYKNDSGLNHPSSIISYESHRGQTLSIDWSSTAGTIYGGYIDLITGKLIQEWQYILINGTQTLYGGTSSSYNGTLGTDRYVSIPYSIAENYLNLSNNNCKSDKLQLVSVGTWSTPNNFIGKYTINARYQLHFVLDNSWANITTDDTATQRTNKISAWLANNPITVVYKLQTPTIITTLTPTQLNSLRGTNNIWSNANGPIDIKYWTH